MSTTNAPPSQESGADRVQVQSGTGAELVFLVKDGVPSERCIQRGCRAQAAAEEYPAGRQRGGGVCVWGGGWTPGRRAEQILRAELEEGALRREYLRISHT